MQLSFINAFNDKISFILLSLVLISGCGFHIKLNDGLAEKYPQIFIQSSAPNGDLVRFVKMRLRGAGINIVNTPASDIAILKIGSVSSSSRTISLSVSAKTAEQELGYNLSYSIQSPGYPAKSFTFNLYRDFLKNSEEALAKSRESELLTQEMNSIAADHIITTMLSLKNETKQPDDSNECDE
jgi:LPS-assembly lipoprotein